MLNKLEKYFLGKISERYFKESRSQHSDEKEDKNCIGCRKMDLSIEIMKFIEDFE